MKKWSEMTDKEVFALKREQCAHCQYFATSGSTNGMNTCDYWSIHKHSRGCSPLECKEKGIFLERTGKRRRKGICATKRGTRTRQREKP